MQPLAQDVPRLCLKPKGFIKGGISLRKLSFYVLLTIAGTGNWSKSTSGNIQ